MTRRAVEELPPKARMALILKSQDKLTYEQIGTQMNIGPEVARRLVQRAMEYLMECVELEDAPPCLN